MINGLKVLDQRQFSRVWQWVEQGGTLILHAENPFLDVQRGDTDLIFERLGLDLLQSGSDHLYKGDEGKPAEGNTGIQQLHGEEPWNHSEAPLPEKPPVDINKIVDGLQDAGDEQRHCAPDIKTHSIQLPGESAPINASFTWGQGFKPRLSTGPELRWWAGPSEQGVMAEYAVARGRVVVASSLMLWQNPHIGCFDHAYLLHYLLRETDAVWLLHNLQAPSLAALLWDAIPYSLLAIALAATAWLWRGYRRFGPLRNPPLPVAPAFLAHLRANGELLWRTRQSPLLVRQLRHDLFARIQRRFPHFNQLDVPQQQALFSQLSGLDPTEIAAALYAEYRQDAEAFLRIMVSLNTLRTRL